MSAHRAAEIWCDYPGCGTARSDYGTASKVRRDARLYDGWRVNLPGGKDLCSDHKDEDLAAQEESR